MKFDYKLFIGVAAVAGIALAASSGLEPGPDAAPAPAGPTTAPEAGGQLPEGHPEIPETSAAAPEMSGVVLEVIQAAGYSYVRLDTDDGEIWAAGPVTELEEGDRVALSGVMEMGRFESPTMDRVFDPLYFTQAFLDPSDAATTGYVGTVKQVLPASRYVYVEVEGDDGATEWLAAPGMEVAAGDRVTWGGGTMMRGFESASLERTFDEILFVTRLEVLPGY